MTASPTIEGTDSSSAPTPSVATVLRPVIERMFGGRVPVRIQAWDGSTLGPSGGSAVVLRSPAALRRLLWSPGELGLSRAYVAGDLDIDGEVFDILDLREALPEADDGDVSAGFSWRDLPGLWRAAQRLGVLGSPPPLPAEEARLHGWRHGHRRDADAISHHYDVGNDFYRLVLGPALTYSCAYWADDSFDLAQAQAAKYELISRKLALEPGMRLLDIGCGWGGMVLHAVEHHGVDAVGITLSQEQAKLARERVREAGLADRIEIRVQDYRDIDDGPFDAVSSIGMFEHVGLARTEEYFADIHELLRPGARVLNHAISRPSPGGKPAIGQHTFMGRYVFPDAELIEVGQVVTAMQRQHLEVRDVESLREHYARTLRAWLDNLEGDWDRAQRLVGPGRARVWRLYIAGAALGFEQNRLAIHQVLGVRTTEPGKSGIAATRDYLDLSHPLPRDAAPTA